MTLNLSAEIQYIVLVLGLFLVPRLLQRFRLPGAVTAVGIGAALNIGFHLFHEDATVKLLAALGIVAMFLFAGLEVDVAELKQNRRILITHVSIMVVMLGVGALVLSNVFELEWRAALLFALALLTPSTGFILDSLPGWGLSTDERFWVKSKAIADELVALGVLFVTVQSVDVGKLGLSALALLAMVLVLPPVFRGFARIIAPFAPKAEFTFLVIVALLCSFITRELGVYYLVGAFVVGVTAVQLRRELPALTSHKLLGAVELFASFFIPFYFFKAGLHLKAENFTLHSLGIAAALLITVVPVRIARVVFHRTLALKEHWRVGARIGTAVVPTLVFTIVIAEILQDRFALESELFGALIIFTLSNTMIPGLVLRLPPPEFETPEVPATLHPASDAAATTSSPSDPR